MITGSIVALVTPMKPDNLDVDWEALDRLVEWHIEQGTHALVAVGTTGESATLSVYEHSRVIKAVVDVSNGRIPVIAGTGANCTREAIELTSAAKDAGVEACLLVTPYYNKPTQEGLYRHYMMIADEVSLPQILYNVPSRTGCDLLNETVIRVADHDNIVGLKDATGDLSRLEELLKLLEAKEIGEFYLYSGDDPTATSFILNGGKGTISVTANIVPEIISEICKLSLDGDSQGALDLDSKLKELNEILFVESNPIPIKWLLNRIGRISDGIRLPLSPFNHKYHNDAEEILKKLNLLN